MKSIRVGTYRALCCAFALIAGASLVGVSAMAQADEAEIQTVDSVEIPSTFVKSLVDRLRALATSSADGDVARRDGFREVLAEDMATRRMQRFILSSQQRSSASEAHLERYNELFSDYITSAYADSIDELVSRRIEIMDVIERRPGDFIVRSKLFATDGEERASIDWRVLEVQDKPQLVDVMVDGLSFNVERRAQFTAIIKKDGFEALVDHMEEQISPES